MGVHMSMMQGEMLKGDVGKALRNLGADIEDLVTRVDGMEELRKLALQCGIRLYKEYARLLTSRTTAKVRADLAILLGMDINEEELPQGMSKERLDEIAEKLWKPSGMMITGERKRGSSRKQCGIKKRRRMN